MKISILGSVLAATALVGAVPPRLARGKEPVLDARDKAAYPAHSIDMPIDHFPDSSRYAPHPNATFKQRYFFDSSYYKPGGPVFLYIGGETSGESRFSNLQTGIVKLLMSQTNGLGVILENRYYGKSYPYENSTTDNLRFLTNEQTIADNAYFAQHATFPGVQGSLNAPHTPWILYGGSLAGAQTAFSIKQYGGDGGILWGGIASSGTTNAQLEYPEWYDQYQRVGPQDCIGYLNGIVDNMDKVFDKKNAADVHKLKALFGLEALTDNRDFAMTVAFPLGGPMNYPTNTWQELNWNKADSSDDFWNFCNNITDMDAPKEVNAADGALTQYSNGEAWTGLGRYANYVKKYIVPLCKGGNINSSGCFGTQNESYWANVANDDSRSYLYTTCTESGGYQTAHPRGPNLLSRVMKVDYTQQWCTWAFPHGHHNHIPSQPDTRTWNKFGGHSVVADRLAHIDGDQDVWVGLCYHSTDAPPRRTANARDAELNPQYLITGAGHHWDSYALANIEDEPQFIREAHKWEIRTVKRWLAEFAKKKTN